MSKIKAFQGYRPRKEITEKVISPPYDVLNSQEARILVGNNKQSFLHVIKPEIDFDENVDLYSDAVYQKGADNLKKFVAEKILVQEEKPSFYIYSQKMGDHFQTGLVCLASAQEYIDDKIKKHEHTKPDKVKDRTKHISVQKAHAGPIFLTYYKVNAINEIIKKYQAQSPTVDVTTEDNVQHILWIIDNTKDIQFIENEFENIDALYIADGHHRSASAVKIYEDSKRTELEDKTAFFLAVLFPHDELKILGYNRVVKDLNGNSKQEFLELLKKNFDVSKISNDTNVNPPAKHTITMYLDKQWYLLKIKAEIIDEDDPVNRLDVAILQTHFLKPVLGIDDPRTNKRIDFIGGIRGSQELEKLVDSKKFEVAFNMYPVMIEDLMSIADASQVMPPKSTWFEPKLRSGMIVNIFG